MSQQLTIAYLSCRKDPKIQWFLDSLRYQKEKLSDPDLKIKVLFIDHHFKNRCTNDEMWPLMEANVHQYEPKPNVWNGNFRLTKEEWFNAANARNTALCLADDGWIAYVDDLSVLAPNWLLTVRQAMSWHGITLGSYRKVRNISVENGVVKSFDDYPQGHDSRFSAGMDNASIPCGGEWLFGCSLVAPVEALLTVGGWPEALCGGLGFEDSIMGLALENAGFKFQYCRSMLTYESEEHHHLDPSFKRSDYGVSPNDKSHAVLNIVQSGCKYFENCYEGGMRKMREEVLSGKPFPVVGNPKNEWYTGKLLSDL